MSTNWNPNTAPGATSSDTLNLQNGTSVNPATTTFTINTNVGAINIGPNNTLTLNAQAAAKASLNNAGVMETASTGTFSFSGTANTNSGFIQANSGGILTLSAMTITNTSGTIRAKTGGTVTFIGSSSVTNGTLQSAAGGVLSVSPNNANSPGGNLTLTTVTVNNAGIFTNEMIYTKAATNNSTYTVTTTLANGTSFTNALGAVTNVTNSGTQGAFSPTGPHDSSIAVQSGATFTNQGTLNVLNTATRTTVSSQQSIFSVATGATFGTTGTINVIASSTDTGATATFTSAQSITNDGIVHIKGNANSQFATFSVTGTGNDYTQSVGSGRRTVLEQGGALTVADQVQINGGTLGGSGTVTGATTIGSGATLIAGDTFSGPLGAGTLAFTNALTLANNSNLTFGLGLNTAGSGQITLAGNSSLTVGSNVSLSLNDLTGGNWVSGTTYRLFDLTSGSISSTSFVMNIIPSGWQAVLSTGVGGTDYLDVTINAIPEPSSFALMLSATVLLGVLHRRRKR